jgi:hypothetical protein
MMIQFEQVVGGPPGALLELPISAEAPGHFLRRRQTSQMAVRMLLDTGADQSCIPETTVAALARDLASHNLPYSIVELLDFNGVRSRQRVYRLKVATNPWVQSAEYDFVVIEGDVGLLGRDVLNSYRLDLDGPNQQWDFIG